jgi:hypothetical protein
MFFDDHPEFLETSTTAATIGRLNLRHLAIIDGHRDILHGARVLDIASHDGRWSFAALDAGAAQVTGVEGRPELVENARRTFAAKGVDAARYTMIAGDVHDVLTAGVGEMDVVMCLGFLYHTLRYPELLAGIRATGARHVIVDSKVLLNTARPLVRVRRNPAEVQSMAVADRFSYGTTTMVGVPSASAIEQMLRIYGYGVVSRPDWARLIADHPEVEDVEELEDYAIGERLTMLAADVGEAAALPDD